MNSSRSAFTLMELVTSIVIIAILATMLLSSVAAIREKAARGSCVSNLKSLYTAASAYLIDNQMWPQIPADDPENPEYAAAWIKTFEPYNLAANNWVCPSVQKLLGNPPLGPGEERLDYMPAQFDSSPNSAWLFPTHPWFLERADVHGDGNLLIFTNGQIYSLTELNRWAKH